ACTRPESSFHKRLFRHRRAGRWSDHVVLHRDVGTLQLLRNASPIVVVHGRFACKWRAWISNGKGGVDLWGLHWFGLSDFDSRRLGRRQTTRRETHGLVRGSLHCPRTFFDGRSDFTDLFLGFDTHRNWHWVAEA